MARDVVVYTQRVTPVVLDEIIAPCGREGFRSSGATRCSSERDRPAWTAGSVLLRGGSQGCRWTCRTNQ